MHNMDTGNSIVKPGEVGRGCIGGERGTYHTFKNKDKIFKKRIEKDCFPERSRQLSKGFGVRNIYWWISLFKEIFKIISNKIKQ